MKKRAASAAAIWLLTLSLTAVSATAQSPNDIVIAIVSQSREALERGNPKQALTVVQDGLRRFPGDEKLQGQLARVYAYEKRDTDAMRVLQDLIRRDPDSREAKIELAKIYGYRENYKISDRLYREVLAQEPDNEAASLGLIRNLLRQGQVNEARILGQEALQRHPNSLGLQRYNDYLSQKTSGGETSASLRYVNARTSYFADASSHRSLNFSQTFADTIRKNITSRLRTEELSLWQSGTQRETVLSGTEEIQLRLSRLISVRAAGGFVRFPEGSARSLYGGDIELKPWKTVVLSGGYSRFPVAPTVESVPFALLAKGWHGRLDWRSRMFSVTGSIGVSDYSDGNSGERESGEAIRWIGGDRFAVGAGYAFRHIHFAEDPGHGYFSPTQYRSHLGIVGLRARIGRFYRGEYTGHGGVESQASGPYTPAGELRLENSFVFGRWDLSANYSRFQVRLSTGAFQANSSTIALGYRF